MARLVLGNPVGIKVGDRETRDILDIFAMSEGEFLEKALLIPLWGVRLSCHNGRRGQGRNPQPRTRRALRVVPVHA
jgi:hypothetical protein